MKRAAWISLLGLAACAGAPAPATVDVAAPRAAAPDKPHIDTTPPVEGTAGKGCSFATKRHLGLRFGPGGKEFGSIGDGEATVDLPTAGPSAGAAARTSHQGFTVRGAVDADEIHLWPARALVLSGFLAPRVGSRFEWVGTSPGVVIVSFKPDEEIEPAREAHLEAQRLSCDDVTLIPRNFDVQRVLPTGANERDGTLRPGRAVGFARTVGGPIVATLRVPKQSDWTVDVVQASGQSLLVRYQGDAAILFGWVSANDVVVTPGRTIRDTFGIGDFMPDVKERLPIDRTVVCRKAVSLLAEVEGERHTIGEVAAGTPIPMLGPLGDLTPIAIPRAVMEPALGARVGVLAGEIKGCSER